MSIYACNITYQVRCHHVLFESSAKTPTNRPAVVTVISPVCLIHHCDFYADIVIVFFIIICM